MSNKRKEKSACKMADLPEENEPLLKDNYLSSRIETKYKTSTHDRCLKNTSNYYILQGQKRKLSVFQPKMQCLSERNTHAWNRAE